jgi:hypothetical protein
MLTLTGYGSGPAPKIGNGEEELAIAAFAAMRDAAAKFLTQFQSLDVAKPLLASQALVPKSTPTPGSAEEAAAAASELTIEALPINETPVVATATPEATPVSVPGATPSPSPEAKTPAPSQMKPPHPTTSL